MFISRRENGVFYLFYKNEAGEQRKVSTRTKLKSEAIRFLRQFDAEQHKRTRNTANITFTEFSAKFLEYVKANLLPRTHELNHLSLNQFLNVTGNLPLGSITAYHGDCFKSALVAKIRPVTVNMRLTKLKAALQMAVRWEMPSRNPLSSVKKVVEPQQTPSFLPKEDFQRL